MAWRKQMTKHKTKTPKTETEPEQKHLVKMGQTIETVKDPGLKEVLTRVMERLKHSDIEKEAAELKKELIKKPKRPEQLLLSFIPHQMAKTSIFFPMSDRELREENRKITRIEHQTGWGKVVIEGIKLAIFEEDILLTLLFLAKDSYIKFKNDFILETKMNKIIHIIYGRKGYSKKNEDVILRTLKNFELVSFDLIIGEWEKKGKERLKLEKIRSVGNIISGFNYDQGSKNLKLYFNSRFFAYFLESMLTNINLTLRRKLKKDGAKALLRFLSTHKQPTRMHILTVLNAINFNTHQPTFRLRSRLKGFLKELKKYRVLGPKTKLYPDDTVFFDILPPKNTLHV